MIYTPTVGALIILLYLVVLVAFIKTWKDKDRQ